jgi:acyl-CoA reductase-like NAD-dependent aldehyde dehydrogenase
MRWREGVAADAAMVGRPAKETEAQIASRCGAKYDPEMIAAVRAAFPEWREWGWAEREKVLARAQERKDEHAFD